jgi:hypothetical protein
MVGLKTGLLLVAIALVASLLATMVMTSNPILAKELFKNKAECMEYVMDSTNLNRNVAAKFCADY